MQILQRPLWIAWSILIGISAGFAQQWQLRAPMPTARQGCSAAVLGDTIYVIGGSQAQHFGIATVEAYHASSDTWSSNVADINIARTAAAAVAFRGKIYLFGGRDHHQFVSDVECYDPATDQWTVVSQIPTPREGLSAVVVDSLIWLIGGANFQNTYSIVERYNPHSNSWDTLPEQLNVPRVAAVAGLINNEVYVLGGFYFGPLNTYEKYVPSQGWVNAGTMLYSCGGASGAGVNGMMWMVGGENQSGILDNVQYADLAGGGPWNNGPSLQLSRKNLAVARVGSQLFAIGGRTDHMGGHVTDQVERLEVLTGIPAPRETPLRESFTLGPNYPNPFNGSTVVEVYLAGRQQVHLAVANTLGQTVRLLYQGPLSGAHRFSFDGRDDSGRKLPSGVYFIYLQTPQGRKVQSAILSQ